MSRSAVEPLARQSMHSLACDSQSPSVTSTSKSCGPVPRPCQELTAVGRRSQWSSAASHADVLGSASVGTCSQASIRARTHSWRECPPARGGRDVKVTCSKNLYGTALLRAVCMHMCMHMTTCGSYLQRYGERASAELPSKQKTKRASRCCSRESQTCSAWPRPARLPLVRLVHGRNPCTRSSHQASSTRATIQGSCRPVWDPIDTGCRQHVSSSSCAHSLVRRSARESSAAAPSGWTLRTISSSQLRPSRRTTPTAGCQHAYPRLPTRAHPRRLPTRRGPISQSNA